MGYHPKITSITIVSYRNVTSLALVALLTTAACSNEVAGPSDVGTEIGRATIHESGWSPPVKLAVSDGGWEDSPYLTRDGGELLFFYHPAADILTNPVAAAAMQDGRIFVSYYPFTTKTQHPVSTPDRVWEAGPYISAHGVFFYHRTDFPTPNRIVRAGQVLDFGTPGHQSNPHYCDAMDELYYDDDANDIWMYKNGVVSRVPPPINGPSFDYQPFLTDDCQTMYFTSNRGSGGAGLPFWVYRATRSASGWNEPTLFISHPDSVGELTISANHRRMVFVELTRVPDGMRTDLYMSERQ